MAQPYVGEIRMFGGNFAPAGWMFCEGQLLPISENETLFQLIGTTYGGDGESTFALPDLRGRLPIHQGNGFTLAETGGAEEIDLVLQQRLSGVLGIAHLDHSRRAEAAKNAVANGRKIRIRVRDQKRQASNIDACFLFFGHEAEGLAGMQKRLCNRIPVAIA